MVGARIGGCWDKGARHVVRSVKVCATVVRCSGETLAFQKTAATMTINDEPDNDMIVIITVSFFLMPCLKN